VQHLQKKMWASLELSFIQSDVQLPVSCSLHRFVAKELRQVPQNTSPHFPIICVKRRWY